MSELEALRAEVAKLREEIAELRQALATPAPYYTPPPTQFIWDDVSPWPGRVGWPLPPPIYSLEATAGGEQPYLVYADPRLTGAAQVPISPTIHAVAAYHPPGEWTVLSGGGAIRVAPETPQSEP